MLRQWMGLGLLAAVLASAGGCCLFGGPAVRYRASGCGDCGECDECAVVRPGLIGRVAAHREAKACRRGWSECDPCGDPCGEAVCPPYRGPHCGPLSFVFSLFRCRTYCGCGFEGCSGCGERYWGEWDNSPDCCDSCGMGGARVPRAARGYVDDDYETPAISARGHRSGCKNCEQGDVTMRSTHPSGYVSKSSYAGARPSGSAARSSSHAPRIVSETDRVVRPAKAVAAAEAAKSETASAEAAVQR